MKNLLLTVVLMFGLSPTLIGQSSNSTISEVEQRRETAERERMREQERQKREQEYNRLKAIGASAPRFPAQPSLLPVSLTKEQEKRRRPDVEDLAKFADFLKLPHTGLFKLFPNKDCFSKNLVRVDEDCQNAIPLSSYYSFQKKDYMGQIAEIGVKDDSFFSRGLLVNALLVTLGDVPIETVSINSNGVKFLADYQPASNNKEVLAKKGDLKEGIKDGNYQYGESTPALENTTYVVRVIAYRGNILIPLGDSGRSYNLLEKDKRADIIVVFRTIRKSEDGSLTILWKQLQQKESPKIELSKQEQTEYLLPPKI